MSKNTRTISPRPWQARPLSSVVYDQAVAEGFTPLQARLLAGRLDALPPTPLLALVRPTVSHLPRAASLPDIDVAVEAIVDAIERELVIAVVSDSDCDGVTSASIAWRALVEVCGVPADRVHVVTAQRRKDGYGVSAGLAERVKALRPAPQLAITCDQGSADQERLAELLAMGIRTVVTDHHEIPVEGPPAAAVACVNPVRADSQFGDPRIAGCGVIWYVFAAVHQALAARNHPGLAPARDLLNLLGLAAIGTTADCVDLGVSYANRWMVQQGLARVSQLHEPIWRAFNPFVRGQWNAISVAFNLVPKVGAAGRMGDAMRGVEAMCSRDDRIAMQWVSVLDQANSTRKEIQKRLVEVAMRVASHQREGGARGLCIPFFEGGHSGVQGIVASRVVEETGCPTVCLCPTDDDSSVLTGSIRSVCGAHVKNLLDEIAASHPELQLRGGGHAGAGGLRMPASSLDGFVAAWDNAVATALAGLPPEPHQHDGPLGAPPSLYQIEQIEVLEPFGRGFPDPVFADDVEVLRVSALGKDRKHAQLELRYPDGSRQRAVWFNSCDEDGNLPAVSGHRRLHYQLRRSTYERGPGFDLLVKEVTDAQ